MLTVFAIVGRMTVTLTLRKRFTGGIEGQLMTTEYSRFAKSGHVTYCLLWWFSGFEAGGCSKSSEILQFTGGPQASDITALSSLVCV